MRVPFLATAITVFVIAGGLPPVLAAQDLTGLPLEQLLDVKVVSASRFAEKASQAPATITVITQEDIRQSGWRTLADVLRSVRGFYIHSDRDYEFVGVRGFARPQDYNSRLLLLIDGHRTNDVVYDMAYIGTDALLDLDLVDRIEIVRGPGSSVYGGNALFGVVNLITRTAAQIDGGELSARYSSFRTFEGRASMGKRFENGVELLASFSGMDSRGPSLYFPEFDAPGTNFGQTSGTDFDRNSRFFGRLSREHLSLTAAVSRRTEGVPTGVGGSAFNDPENANADDQAYLDLAYSRAWSEGTQVSGRVFWADYACRWVNRFSDPPVLYHDLADGTWWGAETKVVTDVSARHKVVAGIEYQRNYRQNQSSFDEVPFQQYLNAGGSSHRSGVFVQDDLQWTKALKLTLGGRFDKVTAQRGRVSPRVGLVFRSPVRTVWKVLYGEAFRAPNVYERDYFFPDTQIANPTLRPETIRSWEAGVEHYLSGQTRLLATGYVYRLDHLVDQAVEAESGLLQYQNAEGVTAHGMEFEAEHQWESGARLRASLDVQRTRGAEGARLTNSPRAVVKTHLSTPLPWWSLRLSAEGQWLASRASDSGMVPDYGIANVNLLRPRARGAWEVSAAVFNLFDRRYADPAAFDPSVPMRDRFEQDGRTFRVKAVYHF